jgi:hypothetical protein
MPRRFIYTTQRQLRRAFWETFPKLPRRRITDYSGTGKMYQTDTRVAWADWIDALAKANDIPAALARRATL